MILNKLTGKRVWSTSALHVKCDEMTFAMNSRYIYKTDLTRRRFSQFLKRHQMPAPAGEDADENIKELKQ